MTSQILVRLDKELKDKFQWLSGIERKSVNEKVRELMEKYVKEHSLEATMKNLWDEIGSSMKKKGYKEADVARMIKKVRSAK
jgi:predicted DNA-binding protein